MGACVVYGGGGADAGILQLPADAPAGLCVNISDVAFRSGNTAASGGAIAVLAPRARLILDHVTFEENSAGVDGGAVLLRAGAALLARDCRFFLNARAPARQLLMLRMLSCLQACCIAHNVLTRLHCVRAQRARTGLGGAVAAFEGASVTIERCWFEANAALLGGA
jgi:hypothetical protein